MTDSSCDVFHTIFEVILVDELLGTFTRVLSEFKVTLALVLVVLGVVPDILHVLEIGVSCGVLNTVSGIFQGVH